MFRMNNDIRDRRTPMRTSRWLALSLGLFACLVAGVVDAHAQGFQERKGRVEQELEKTDRQMEFVADRAVGADLPRARKLFEEAKGLQSRAWSVFRRVGGDTSAADAEANFRQSLTLTLRARDLVHRAAQQLREDLSFEENARRTLERLRDRISRVEDSQASSVSQARQLMEQAEKHFRDGRFEQALRLAQNASSLLEGAGSGENVTDLGGLLERMRDRLERAREAAAGDPVAERAVAQAANRLRQAVRAAENDRPRLAEQHLQDVRRLLDRVMRRESGPQIEATQVERALERLDANLARIHDRVGGNPPRELARLVTKAEEARDRARRELGAGNLEGAVQQVRAATDLLARIQRMLGRG